VNKTLNEERKVTTINPATEQVLEEYQIISKGEIGDRIKKAQNAFQDWKKDTSKRSDTLHDFANELRKEKENLAKTATNEMGKVIKEARSEVEKCAWVIEYYADNGKILSTDEVVNTEARKTVIKFQPIGVIGSIMPWNFPYWQALRFAAPSLMVGNTIVLKPASATMQGGIEIERTFNKVGLPQGVFQTKAITYYLRLIDDLYKMLEDQFRSEKKEDKDKFEKLRARYKKVSEEHGAEIKGVYYITRSEPFPSLYENADFSMDTIKASIKDGEIKTNQILKNISK
jgi:hypothetical protein